MNVTDDGIVILLIAAFKNAFLSIFLSFESFGITIEIDVTLYNNIYIFYYIMFSQFCTKKFRRIIRLIQHIFKANCSLFTDIIYL